MDTSDTATATDLADSITNDTRTGTDVVTIDQTAIGAVAIVTITANITGELGNSIGLSSSDGGTLAVSAALLASGVDPREFETISDAWRYVIIMAKSTSGPARASS